ncbi:MAG: hypothetical protein ACYTGL_29175 [Planctomycetota bacterium]
MKILLVDDEVPDSEEFQGGEYMWYYTNALRRAGSSIHVASSTDRALEYLNDPSITFDGMLLDVIMPIGGWLNDPKESMQGTRTGLLFARHCGENYPSLPIIVLTHVDDASVTDKLESLENVRRVLHKHECLPFELVDHVEKCFQK